LTPPPCPVVVKLAQSTTEFSSWQVETGNTSLNERPALSTPSRTASDAHGQQIAAPSNFDSVFQNTVLFSRRQEYLDFPRPGNIARHISSPLNNPSFE
jgi:hypothetical protein